MRNQIPIVSSVIHQCTQMRFPWRHTIYTAYTRPDCWDALRDPKHPLNAAWPAFLDHNASQAELADKVLDYPSLRRFQLAVMERDGDENETIIAHACSIPFFWPELEGVTDGDIPHVLGTLPDRGWDSIVAQAIRQHCVREGLPLPLSCSQQDITTLDKGSDPGCLCSTADSSMSPNALSALSITVGANRRSCGFAETLIEAMKQVAREEGLRVLVVPLRPTRKSEYPWVSMEKYVGSTLSDPPATSWLAPTAAVPGHPHGSKLPFDPWLRKHVRLGGSLVKIAPSSLIVQGNFAEWQSWTGINFNSLVRDRRQAAQWEAYSIERQDLEVAIPGGLVPLMVSIPDERCTYTEPNVWLYHKDLILFSDGDLTEIGANGVNLSGGQRWRVSFARALYSRAGILVLDDVLSSLDSKVGRQLLEEALAGDLGVGKTRILITHHVDLCQSQTRCAKRLAGETVEFAGLIEGSDQSTTDERLDNQAWTNTDGQIDDGPDSNLSDFYTAPEADANGTDHRRQDNRDPAERKKFTEEETGETRSIQLEIYRRYLSSAGGVTIWFLMIVCFVGATGMDLTRVHGPAILLFLCPWLVQFCHNLFLQWSST
ncbi:MAG: hypothetical protein Q9204_003413 [Flavoplaca sp. TL-2023a]